MRNGRTSLVLALALLFGSFAAAAVAQQASSAAPPQAEKPLPSLDLSSKPLPYPKTERQAGNQYQPPQLCLDALDGRVERLLLVFFEGSHGSSPG